MKTKFLILIFLSYGSLFAGFGDIGGWISDRFKDVKDTAEKAGEGASDILVTTINKGVGQGADILKKSEDFVTQTADKVNDTFSSLGGKIEDVTTDAINTVQQTGKDVAGFFKSCGSAAGLYAAYVAATAALKAAQAGLNAANIINLKKAFDAANTALSQMNDATNKFGNILQTLTATTFNIKNFKIEGQIPNFNFAMNGILFGKTVNVSAGVDFDSIKALTLSLIEKVLPQVADVAGLGLDLGNILLNEVRKL